MRNYKKDDVSLVRIVLDYLEGEEIEVIKYQLKLQSMESSCTARYQEMTKHRLETFISSILNALSIGGCELHLLSLETAQQRGYTHCYIWNNNQLIYLDAENRHEDVPITDVDVFSSMINRIISSSHKKSTIHLFADQISDLITKNSNNHHVPPTSDLEQIENYKKSPNFYALLKKLAVKHRHLLDLIDLIDEIKPVQNWGLYFMFAAGVTAGSSILYHLKDNIDIVKAWFENMFPILSRWLGNTVHLLRNTPLVGIVLNAIPLLNTWRRSISDEAGVDKHKLIKLFLKTMSHFLPIIGYMLCYLAGATMTIPALTLFISGAIIDVVDSLHTIAKDEYERWTNPLPSGTEYYSQTAKTRANNLYERGLLVFLVNFIASLLTTVSVIIWCVFPPSLMIALPSVMFAWCVGMAKHSLLSHINKEYTNALQRDLQDLCSLKPPQDVSQCLPNDPEKSQLISENMQLKKQIEERRHYDRGYKDGFVEGQTSMFSFVAGPTLFHKRPSFNTPTEMEEQPSPFGSVDISYLQGLRQNPVPNALLNPTEFAQTGSRGLVVGEHGDLSSISSVSPSIKGTDDGEESVESSVGAQSLNQECK